MHLLELFLSFSFTLKVQNKFQKNEFLFITLKCSTKEAKIVFIIKKVYLYNLQLGSSQLIIVKQLGCNQFWMKYK